VEQQVLEELLNKLNAEYGKETPLTVSRGTKHEYIGMTIDWTTSKKVVFSMFDLVQTIIEQLPKNVSTGPDVTPAANHLFQVKENGEKLSSEDADLFHRLTAQLLYLGKRARPDLQTAVAFLTTRVQSPDMDDLRKLGRVIRYLRRTAHWTLTLEADSMTRITWSVDASYAVHPDMRSHTGATMTFGKGSAYSTSLRQKMNGRSSTEAELIGVNDVMGIILWTRHFLEAQGYEVVENVILQDNESAILLEKNGRQSSTKRTRHLEIRYFFVTDNVNRKRITIEHCPTGDMTGDYFTKPVQGSLFKKHVKAILNLDDEAFNSSPQECVGRDGTDQKEMTDSNDKSVRPTSRTDVEEKISSHVSHQMAKNQKTYAEALRNERGTSVTFSNK
jgi:hypothetical protein